MATQAQLQYVVKVQDRDLRELQRRIRATNTALGGVGGASASATRSLNQTTASIARQSNVWKGLRAQVALTSTAFLGGAGLLAVFRSTINVAAQFETSMNVLQSVSRGTATQMAAAAREARRLGKDAQLPKTSAADAATAMTELAKAGLDVSRAMQAARGTLALSTAANISAGEAAVITGRALNAFNLQGREASQVADLLAAAANAASGEIPDVAIALQQSSAVAHQFGLSVTDTVTAITQLAKAGIVGSDAGTSLRTMLQRLVPQTDKAASAMGALGIKWRDSSGNLTPLRGLVGQYQAALDKLSPAQRQVALQTIFGTDAQRAAAIILRGGVKEWDKMTTAVSRQGAASEIARARNKGFAGAMDALRSNIETLQIQIGGKLLPVLTDYLKRANEWLSNTKNADRVQRDIIATLELVGGALKTLARSVKTVKDAFDRFADAVGGAKNALKLLVALSVAWKATALIATLQGIGTAATVAAGGAAGASGAGLLLKRLKLLKGIGPIAIAIATTNKVFEEPLLTPERIDLLRKKGGGGGPKKSSSFDPKVRDMIVAEAIKRNLDPQAVQAVALGEGGLKFGAVGDGGHAFGPFQMNDAGGVLTGRPGSHSAFANSLKGIQYALNGMVAAGAADKEGLEAIHKIIYEYERPKDKPGSYGRAMENYRKVRGGAYGTSGGGGGGGGAGGFGKLAGVDSLGTGGLVPEQQVTVSSRRLPVGQGRPSTKGHVIAFVRRVAAIYGGPLTITDNSTHSVTTSGGRVSDHAAGNAADIGMSGANLTKLGQAALVAAGYDSAKAAKETGGIYYVGGVQILFNVSEHYDHLHVGLKTAVTAPSGGFGVQTVTAGSTPSSAVPRGGSGGRKPRDPNKAIGSSGLPFGIDKALSAAKLTPRNLDDLKAARAAEGFVTKQLADARKRVGTKGNRERVLELTDRVAGFRDQIRGIIESRKPKGAGPKGAGTLTLLPRDIREQIIDAEGTAKTLADDVAALKRAERFLAKALAGSKGEKRLDIKTELNRVRGQISGLKEGKGKGTGTLTLLPRGIREAIVDAEGTVENLADDLAALKRAETFLSKALAGSKGEKRLDIKADLNRTRDQIRSIQDQIQSTKADASDTLDFRTEVAGATAALKEIGRGVKVEVLDRFGQVTDVLSLPVLRRRLAEIRKEMKTATTPEALQKLRDQFEQVAGGIEQAAQKTRELRDRIRELKLEKAQEQLAKLGEIMGDSFGDIVDRAMTAFDARTEAFTKKISDHYDRMRAGIDSALEGTVDGIERWRGELTAAEAQIKALEDNRDSSAFAERLLEAQTEFDRATLRGSRRRIATARKALDEVVAEGGLRGLQAQAQTERAARDKLAEERKTQAQAEADAAKDALSKQQANDERDLNFKRTSERREFGRRLEALRESLSKSNKTASEKNEEIIRLFAEFDVDYAQSGYDLGNAFAVGFETALREFFEKTLPEYLQAAATVEVLSQAPVSRSRIAAGGSGSMAFKPMAAGGIVTRPTYALIGEAGPEAVIPLKGGGAGTVEIHLHVGQVIGNDLSAAASELAGPIRRELLRTRRRNVDLGMS